MSDTKKVNRRIYTFFSIILILWGVIFYRLYTLQVVDTDSFIVSASNQQEHSVKIFAPRGTIKSSDGMELAINIPTYSLEIFTPNIKNIDNFKQNVLPIIPYDKIKFENLLKDGYKDFILKNDISIEEKETLEKKIASKDLVALNFILQEKRIYPNNSLLSHVIGYTSINDHSGKYGIEGYFNNFLKGVDGSVSGNVDSTGSPIVDSKFNVNPPQAGSDITLTINAQIQKVVEDKLKKWVNDKLADGGSAIIMNPKTGAIISMANYPTYNPNEYFKGFVIDCATYLLRNNDICNGKSTSLSSELVNESLSNTSISYLYEPGSVLKIVTAAAALEEGKITETTTVNDPTGYYEVGNHKIFNWNKKPNGIMNMQDILNKSSNVGASLIAEKVGTSGLAKYYKSFGLADKTGITLQGEEASHMPESNEWKPVDLATASFGQFIGLNPLQVIGVYQTIANKGVRMQPYIVESILKDGKVENTLPKKVNQVISTSNDEKLIKMLVYTTTGESGIGLTKTKSFIPIIASKTGTAQIPLKDRGGYEDKLINATYVAFAPAEDPKFVMLVDLRAPRNSTFAYDSAEPLWDDIAKDLFIYYKITP